jgi:hypothetical protein
MIKSRPLIVHMNNLFLYKGIKAVNLKTAFQFLYSGTINDCHFDAFTLVYGALEILLRESLGAES